MWVGLLICGAVMRDSPKEYVVELCERKEIRDFVEKWHYSHNINGLNSTYCFKLMDDGKIIGAMIYGRLGMANVWKKYGECVEDTIELKRLCCIDNTPKNTESYFIGKTLKWLTQNTDIKVVISYADPFYEHSGIIYKATNFVEVGLTNKGRIIWYNGKRYHDKVIRNKYNGKLKKHAIEIKKALEEGKAKYVKTPGKHIFVYELRGRKKRFVQ